MSDKKFWIEFHKPDGASFTMGPIYTANGLVDEELMMAKHNIRFLLHEDEAVNQIFEAFIVDNVSQSIQNLARVYDLLYLGARVNAILEGQEDLKSMSEPNFEHLATYLKLWNINKLLVRVDPGNERLLREQEMINDIVQKWVKI